MTAIKRWAAASRLLAVMMSLAMAALVSIGTAGPSTAVPPNTGGTSTANVTGKADVVGNDNIVSQVTVMSNMNVVHKKVIIAENCFSTFIGGSVNGDKFPNLVIVAKLYVGFLTFIAYVLGGFAYNGALENFVILTDGCPARN